MFTLTCMAAELARAVNLVTFVSGNSRQLAVLKSSMIEVGGGTATIAATDMDHSVRVSFAADGEGLVFIDTAALAQKSGALRPNSPVTISGDEKSVTISQGKTKWKLPVIDGTAFPLEITKPIPGDAVQIDCAKFVNAMTAARVVVRDLNSGVINMGVYLDANDGLRAVGGDTRGLSVVEISDATMPISVVVPTGSISAIFGIFRSAETLDIVVTENGMTVSADGVTYRTKLIEQAYVDWRRAQAANIKDLNGSVIMDAADLIGVVKRATAIAEDKSKDGTSVAVRLVFSGGECCATAKNRNGEEGVDYCPAEGDDASCMVTAGFLLDIAGSFTSERLKISMNTQTEGAIKIEPYPTTEFENVRILMPRRL